MARPRILYIAGYGRSGSTVLDIVLGSHPSAVGLGEVTYLFEEAVLDRKCACGKPFRECSLWHGALAEVGDPRRAAKTIRVVERRLFLPWLVLGRGLFLPRRRYAAIQGALLAHVRRVCGAPVLVDSSKTARGAAGRALALAWFLAEDVRVIHLVRDAREVLRSLVATGSNWALEGRASPPRLPAFRAMSGWLLSNLSAAFLGRLLGRRRYLRLRFHDLLDDPEAVLTRICEWAGLDTAGIREAASKRGPFRAGHQVGGNRLRAQREIHIRKPNGDADSLAGLPVRARIAYHLFASLLNRHYGFPARADGGLSWERGS